MRCPGPGGKTGQKEVEMMTDKQIKVIEELLNTDGIKGKQQLRHVLWLNTSTPKFQIGDCFVVSDPGHRVYGYLVKGFKGKVTEVRAFGGGLFGSEWQYTLEMQIECGGQKTVSKVFKAERQLIGCRQCEDNINILGEMKVEYEETEL